MAGVETIMRGVRRHPVRAVIAGGIAAAGICVGIASALTGGTEGSLTRASRSGEVLEMFASFQGKWGSYFGRSHEWYAPRSGVFRVEGSVQGRSQAQVFDGSSWWSEYEGRVERQSGPPAMFRWLFDRSRPLFAKPGLGTAAVDSLLGRRRSKLLVVRSRDGGRVIEGEFKLDGLAQGPARFRFGSCAGWRSRRRSGEGCSRRRQGAS